MGKSDFIGSRGESIAFTRLTEVCRKNDLPYFLPHYLGEKCPTFDFLVELVGVGETRLYFFVQVKATRKGYSRKSNPARLKARVKASDVKRMTRYPAPTYVVGVDEKSERAFVIGVYGNMSDAIPDITTAHELNCVTLRHLWDEVRAFWRGRSMRRKTSAFTN
jgi:hypothetical protein